MTPAAYTSARSSMCVQRPARLLGRQVARGAQQLPRGGHARRLPLAPALGVGVLELGDAVVQHLGVRGPGAPA